MLATLVALPQPSCEQRDDGSHRWRSAENGQASNVQRKGGRMERVELRDEKLRVSVVHARSSATGSCTRHCDEPRHQYDKNQSHFLRKWRDSGPETLSRLGDEREEASVGSDQRNHRQEPSIGMGSVDHEIRSKHSAAGKKSHERNPQCEDLSLRPHSL